MKRFLFLLLLVGALFAQTTSGEFTRINRATKSYVDSIGFYKGFARLEDNTLPVIVGDVKATIKEFTYVEDY